MPLGRWNPTPVSSLDEATIWIRACLVVAAADRILQAGQRLFREFYHTFDHAVGLTEHRLRQYKPFNANEGVLKVKDLK